MLLAFAILGLLALVAARLDGGEDARLSGAPVISDGDSLTFGAERVRLIGIDAPEYDQVCQRNGRDYPCGRDARSALSALVGREPVTCEGRRRDRYGRLLATCSAGDVNLNRALVEAGWAVAFGDYKAEEDAARAAKRGLWAGSFARPRDWRVSHGGLAVEHGGFDAAIDWLRGIFGFS